MVIKVFLIPLFRCCTHVFVLVYSSNYSACHDCSRTFVELFNSPTSFTISSVFIPLPEFVFPFFSHHFFHIFHRALPIFSIPPALLYFPIIPTFPLCPLFYPCYIYTSSMFIFIPAILVLLYVSRLRLFLS